MKTLLLTLATSISLWGQTQIRPSDIKPDATTVNQIYAAMVIGNGVKFGALNIDTSLIIDTTTTPWTLKVANPNQQQPINFIVNETPTGTPNGTLTSFGLQFIPVAGSLAVYRNGLRLKPNFDYGVSGSTITFLPGAVPQTGDVLLADYRR